jgi:hypothetical protein
MNYELMGALVGVTLIAGLVATCTVENSGPCAYVKGEIIYRRLDGVRGVIVQDSGCHMSHEYIVKFTDRPDEEQSITETELQKTPEILK